MAKVFAGYQIIAPTLQRHITQEQSHEPFRTQPA